MLDLEYTNQMKRDVKLAKKRGRDLKKLTAVIEFLQNRKPLPEKYRNHKLSGDYKDHWECHIEPDFLLIYLIISSTLKLVRLGTHSDLFE